MQPPTPYGGDQPYQQFNAGASSGPAAGRRVHLGDLLTLIGGAFVFFFSFAPFMAYPDRAVSELVDSTFDGWFMAWSPQMFMAPLTWWVIFAGLGLIGLSAWRILTSRDPELLRIRASQVQLAFGLFAFLVLLGYALSHKQISFGLDKYIGANTPEYELYQPSFGWGGYLMLIGAIVATTGAVGNHFNLGPDFAIPIRPAPPAPPQQWLGAGPAQPGAPAGQEGVFPGGAPSPYPQQGYPPAQPPYQQGFPQPPATPPTQQFQTPPGYQQGPPTQ